MFSESQLHSWESKEKDLFENKPIDIDQRKILNDVLVPVLPDDGPLSCYHCLHYDSISQSAVGSSMAPKDLRFATHVGHARQLFLEDDNVETVMLRDFKSGVYCKKTFATENYFQPGNPSAIDTFLEHIEQTAETRMRVDHKISLL